MPSREIGYTDPDTSKTAKKRQVSPLKETRWPNHKRIRRLEVLFFTLLVSLGEDGYDEDSWYELRRLFSSRRDRDFYDYFERGEDSEFVFLERLQERRRREQPESLRRQIEELRREVSALWCCLFGGRLFTTTSPRRATECQLL